MQEMSKRDETETSYFHKKLLSFHKKKERTESLWKTPWDGQVREEKGDGLCLIFYIFFEDNGIFVKGEKRLYGNGEKNRKNISSNFNGIKKSGIGGCHREEEHKVVSGRIVSEIKACCLNG